jgi:hypothetical protein
MSALKKNTSVHCMSGYKICAAVKLPSALEREEGISVCVFWKKKYMNKKKNEKVKMNVLEL